MTTASPTPGDPAELDALAAYAEREHRARRLPAAAAAYRQLLAVRPEVAETYNNLGNVLLEQGLLGEAEAHYRRALALKPGLFQAHNNLGNVLRKQGRLQQAAEKYAQVLVLKPDFANAHYNLAGILWEQGRLDEAVARYQQAIALAPDHAEAHNNLGGVLQDQEKHDDSAAQFERALALKPNLCEAHNNLGVALRRLGKFDEAMAHFDEALAIRPDFAEAHYYRTDLKTFRAQDSDLAALEALAAESPLPPSKMVFIHFALGKALEDVGEHERAFRQLLQGNALKRGELRYDEAAHQQIFQHFADTFDAALLSRLSGAGDPSQVPIFIVGMPRSGSTLIEQILASHPQVQAAGELKTLDRVVRAVPDSAGGELAYPACVSTLDADRLRRLAEDYLASLPALAVGKTRITDKTPFNYLYLGLIHLMLPNARIIHTQRDPVDTCVSCFSRLFTTGALFSFDLAELGCYYRWYYQLMDHWRSVLPEALLDVSYEETVNNLEAQARRLIDYCGLPWDDRCLSFHETRRTIATPSNVQVRRPLYRSSLARWRRYEAFLAPLLAELESCRQ